MEHLKNNRNRSVEQSMKRRCLRIYRKRRKKKLIILILTCILFLGTAAAERGGYLELEQFGSNKKQDIPYQKVSITEEENTEKYYYQQGRSIRKFWKVSETTRRKFMYITRM